MFQGLEISGAFLKVEKLPIWYWIPASTSSVIPKRYFSFPEEDLQEIPDVSLYVQGFYIYWADFHYLFMQKPLLLYHSLIPGSQLHTVMFSVYFCRLFACILGTVTFTCTTSALNGAQ